MLEKKMRNTLRQKKLEEKYGPFGAPNNEELDNDLRVEDDPNSKGEISIFDMSEVDIQGDSIMPIQNNSKEEPEEDPLAPESIIALRKKQRKITTARRQKKLLNGSLPSITPINTS